MAKISGDTADIPAVRFNEQSSDVAAPTAGGWKLYFKSGGLYARNAGGTVIGPFTPAGDMALNDLADVDADIVGEGDVLAFQGAAWAPLTLPTGGGDITADAAWQAADDLVVGSGVGTAAILTVGDEGDVLTVGASGLEWAAPAGGGAVATDAIFDAKGDLPVGTGANTAARLAMGTNGQRLAADTGETTGLKWVAETRVITLGIAGSLALGGGALRFYLPWACTITNIRATVGTAPTGASLIVDVHQNGTTLFSTQGNRPTITAGNFSDLTNSPDVTALAKDDYLQVYCDQVGSTVPGSDLHIQIEVTVP